jgi:site-specific DNA-methyltransferase (adenine-specific)
MADTIDVERAATRRPLEPLVSQPFFSRDGVEVHNRDCRDVLADLPDSSIDLIVTDPPYFKVKDEPWDRQWDTAECFLAWMGKLCDEWQRVLKPNGSLYVFASPQMAWGVEGEVRKRFNVLTNIRWIKADGWANRQCKEEQRAPFPASETIIFAEHFGADNIAKGEAGYGAKCDELRGFVFEPLRAYLDGERERAGFSVRQVAEAFQLKSGSRTVTGMAGHWFGRVQWMPPTAENYAWLRELFAGDFLRREYEDLRREYEDLRRPFNVTADVPYTDVWDFPTVGAYEGKHPCEKPLAMMEHIITASSKPGAVVLDCFAGSGVVGEAARNCGRLAILCEIDAGWCEKIKNMLRQGRLFAAAG